MVKALIMRLVVNDVFKGSEFVGLWVVLINSCGKLPRVNISAKRIIETCHFYSTN